MLSKSDAWGLTFLLALTLEPISFVTASVPPCIVGTYHQYANDVTGETCPALHEFLIDSLASVFEKLGDPAWATVVATIVIAIFTGTLWWSTYKLWDAGERQLRHLEASSQRQLRAYVGVEWCRVASPDGGNTFEVEVQIKNTGQTPAFEIRHRIAAELQIVHAEPLRFERPELKRGVFPLNPGLTFIIKEPIAIGGPSGIGDIGTRKFIFSWGRVDYLDAFGVDRYFEFRFRNRAPVRAHDGTIVRTVGWQMEIENEGNASI
jgi:hypothetical protein